MFMFTILHTLIFPSSDPVATMGTPLLAGQHVLTKEEWPLSFLILSPTSQSHTAPVLSTEHENNMLWGACANKTISSSNRPIWVHVYVFATCIKRILRLFSYRYLIKKHSFTLKCTLDNSKLCYTCMSTCIIMYTCDSQWYNTCIYEPTYVPSVEYWISMMAPEWPFNTA